MILIFKQICSRSFTPQLWSTWRHGLWSWDYAVILTWFANVSYKPVIVRSILFLAVSFVVCSLFKRQPSPHSLVTMLLLNNHPMIITVIEFDFPESWYFCLQYKYPPTCNSDIVFISSRHLCYLLDYIPSTTFHAYRYVYSRKCFCICQDQMLFTTDTTGVEHQHSLLYYWWIGWATVMVVSGVVMVTSSLKYPLLCYWYVS